jgi:very-short-patch-repair endonuclease
MTTLWAPPTEQKFSPPSGPSLPPPPPPPVDRRSFVDRKVARWADQLIDRSAKNRLLYYKPSKATLELDVGVAAGLVAGRPVRLSELFAGQRDDLRDAERRVLAILRSAGSAFEELGFSTLFVGLHMVRWPGPSDKSKPCAPFLLCPLTIERRGVSDFDLTISSEWEVNGALRLVLDRDFRIPVDSAALLGLAGTPPTAAGARRAAEQAVGGIAGFSIDDRLVVTNFSYQDLAIVEDLKSGAGAYADSDLVAAMTGFESARAEVRERNIARDATNAQTTSQRKAPLLIHDADWSQEAAIQTALDGHDLVVDGPPGTGKSQTIANLIAALIADGKTVLFVAEKRAAIDAVSRYLGDADLKDLMFDLHTGVESPRRLAQTVRQAMEAVEQVPNLNHSNLDATVEDRRRNLESRWTALHGAANSWNISLFDALMSLYGIAPAARVDAAPIPPEHLQSVSADTLGAVDNAVQTFVELDGLRLRNGGSAWSQAFRVRTITSPEAALAAVSLATRLRQESVPSFRRAADALVVRSGIVRPQRISGWPSTFDLFREVKQDLVTFDERVFGIPIDDLIAKYAPVTRGLLLRAASMVTSGEYRAARREVADLVRVAAVTHSADLHGKLQHAARTRSDWSKIAAGTAPSEYDQEVNSCGAAYAQLAHDMQALAPMIGMPFGPNQTIEEVEGLLDRLLTDRALADRLPKLCELDSHLQHTGFEPLINHLAASPLDPALSGAAARWTWYRMVVGQLMAQRPIADLPRPTLDRLVTDFQTVDSRLVQSASARVRRRWAEAVFATRTRLPAQQEALRQLALSRSGLKPSSVRRLLAESPEMLLSLRPCWAMSPLIVSKLLPQVQGLFDVVVFDEASQIKPIHAIPSIFRAKRVVVCGDDKQLPPTSFFDVGVDEDDEVEADEIDSALSTVEGMESILDALSAAITRRMTLRWHYRSRDERLIAFCNARPDLYAGRLVTFPGAHVDAPLHHVQVTEPTNDRTTSPHAEVDQVVELVRQHARRHPERTLGVITLGLPHAARIEKAVQSACEDDPDLASYIDTDSDEGFFVKSIEKVQGDERDSIILSVGLGHNADGRLLNYLGAVNHEGGFRRLNVAFTRARCDYTVVTSFSATDLSGPSFSSIGASMLADFVRYAASGGTSHVRTSVLDDLNPFESDVARVLTSLAIPFRPQWGASGFSIDFALEDREQPGRFVLAVECDGRTYHSSPTARDRDRLRQQHLERLGWSFHRIWSTSWYNARQPEIDALAMAYERALERRAAPVTPPAPAEVASVPRVERGPRPGVPLRSKIDEYRPEELVAVIRWIKSDTLLRSKEQLVRLAFVELGFQRLGPKIREALERAADAAE